jgi:hypothetical protein
LRELVTMPGMVSTEAKSVELFCQIGQHKWYRPSQRGRRPFGCPACTAKQQEQLANNKPQVDEAERDARLAKAREVKKQRAQERHQETLQEQEQRRERIRTQLPSISYRWNRAFDVAMRENTDEAWKNCESLMTGYVTAKNGLVK